MLKLSVVIAGGFGPCSITSASVGVVPAACSLINAIAQKYHRSANPASLQEIAVQLNRKTLKKTLSLTKTWCQHVAFTAAATHMKPTSKINFHRNEHARHHGRDQLSLSRRWKLRTSKRSTPQVAGRLLHALLYGGFHKWGTPRWMVYNFIMEKSN